MNRDGRVTLPAAARKALGLRPNDRLAVEIYDGALVLRPVTTIPRSVMTQLDRHQAEGMVYRGMSPDDLERFVAGEEIDLDRFAIPADAE
jgi:AbrB family looped-hinge helix DNA binding protein